MECDSNAVLAAPRRGQVRGDHVDGDDADQSAGNSVPTSRRGPFPLGRRRRGGRAGNFPAATLELSPAGVQPHFDGSAPIYMYITTATAERCSAYRWRRRTAAGRARRSPARCATPSHTTEVPFDPGCATWWRSFRAATRRCGTSTSSSARTTIISARLRRNERHPATVAARLDLCRGSSLPQGGADDSQPEARRRAAEARSTPSSPTSASASDGEVGAPRFDLQRRRRRRLGSVSVLEIAAVLRRTAGQAEALDPLRLARRRRSRGSRLRASSPIIPPCRATRSSPSSTWTWSVAVRRPTITGRQQGRGQSCTAVPSYLQLVGSRRLSTELGDLVETVNHIRTSTACTFDYSHGRQRPSAEHLLPQRSLRVRALRHSDRVLHHRRPRGLPPGDRRAAVHRLRPGWRRSTTSSPTWRSTSANLDHRVVVDKPKPDPNGQCQQ